jgi:phosphoenolpyruvate---glycerone phosphotransferase subunit DhaK
VSDADFIAAWFARIAARFAAEEAALGALDARVGDGDHGATMARAARAAAGAAAATDADAAARLGAGGRAFADAAGGASGPLIASIFVALAAAVRARGGRLSTAALKAGLAGAVDLVRRMGRCAPGDKTLLDALAPAAAAVGDDLPAALAGAAAAAAAGRDATERMRARRGRAAWVEGMGEGIPDPGATSVALILAEAVAALASGAPPLAASDRAVTPLPPRAAPHGKLLNDPAAAVDEMIDGFTLAFPERVRRLDRSRVVLRATPKPAGHTALVIGNGSGHEPIALGWVGRGLLDANAVGPIFTAPAPTLIAQAIAAADPGGGVLLLISHHEGDRIAGELAAELARAEGHDVRTLLMYDDVASAPRERAADRRGGPGTAFIYKIVGAALEEGWSLARAAALGERVRDATRTLSVAVAGGTSPISGDTMFTLPEGEVYLGMGVHGEPGFARMSAASVDAIVERVLAALIDDGEYRRGERVLAFVNGAGGTSLMELLVATRAALLGLRAAGLTPLRPLVGSYVTTQETRGLALSLCRVDPEIERFWLAPTDAPFFHL